jgi:hypothetical protein
MNGIISILKAVKKFKTQLSSTGKIMERVFWDSYAVINVDFLPHGGTMNALYSSNLLHNVCTTQFTRKDVGNCQRR